MSGTKILNRKRRGRSNAAAAGEPYSSKCGMLIPRDDHHPVRVVEELVSKANGRCAEIKVVSIPDNVKWEIKRQAVLNGAVKCITRGVNGQGVPDEVCRESEAGE